MQTKLKNKLKDDGRDAAVRITWAQLWLGEKADEDESLKRRFCLTGSNSWLTKMINTRVTNWCTESPKGTFSAPLSNWQEVHYGAPIFLNIKNKENYLITREETDFGKRLGVGVGSLRLSKAVTFPFHQILYQCHASNVTVWQWGKPKTQRDWKIWKESENLKKEGEDLILWNYLHPSWSHHFLSCRGGCCAVCRTGCTFLSKSMKLQIKSWPRTRFAMESWFRIYDFLTGLCQGGL